MALDPRVRFGLKLVEIRKTKGWSQEGLALESGLARSYLGGVERGQRNIALLNIFALAGRWKWRVGGQMACVGVLLTPHKNH